MSVYQAVAEYWASDKESDFNLNVDIKLPGRLKLDKYNFNRENHHTTRTSKVRTQALILTNSGSLLLSFLLLSVCLFLLLICMCVHTCFNPHRSIM